MPLTEERKKAYTEVCEVLNHMTKTDVEKIPKDIRDYYIQNSDKTYNFQIDETKPFSEQSISYNAKLVLAMFYRDYWALPEEKEKIIAKEKNDIQIEKQKVGNDKNASLLLRLDEIYRMKNAGNTPNINITNNNVKVENNNNKSVQTNNVNTNINKKINTDINTYINRKINTDINTNINTENKPKDNKIIQENNIAEPKKPVSQILSNQISETSKKSVEIKEEKKWYVKVCDKIKSLFNKK